MKRYDRDHDLRLSYSEFSTAFTPKTSPYSHDLNVKGPSYTQFPPGSGIYFTPETRDYLRHTFDVHFEVESHAEYMREDLNRSRTFSIHDAFTAVDKDRKGYITRHEFSDILREYGFYALPTEITWLVDRYDRDRDGRVSYSDFVDEILPKSPSKR